MLWVDGNSFWSQTFIKAKAVQLHRDLSPSSCLFHRKCSHHRLWQKDPEFLMRLVCWFPDLHGALCKNMQHHPSLMKIGFRGLWAYIPSAESLYMAQNLCWKLIQGKLTKKGFSKRSPTACFNHSSWYLSWVDKIIRQPYINDNNRNTFIKKSI